MRAGDAVVVNATVYDVVKITFCGDVLLRNSITMEHRWVDYYLTEIIDPHKSPEALLEALSHLRGEVSNEEELSSI